MVYSAMVTRAALLLLLASTIAFATQEADTVSNDAEETLSKSPLHLANAQIDWVVSKGGYFDTTRIAIQSVEESDGKTTATTQSCPIGNNLGIYAIDDIDKGEVLMKIPISALMSIEDASQDRCDTALMLHDQARKAGASEYAPYVEYLYSKEGSPLIPSLWSDDGKALLKSVHAFDHRNDLGDTSFLADCLQGEDEFKAKLTENRRRQIEFAYAITLSRCWDEKLTPIIDMINHGSWQQLNVNIQTTRDGSLVKEDADTIEVRAMWDISKGEQLFLDYRSRDEKKDHHVATTLQFFGFVEPYPQRWKLPTPGKRSNIQENNIPFDIEFEVIRVESDDDVDDDHGYRIKWLEPLAPPPFQEVEDHLRAQLARIVELGPFVESKASELASENERSVVLEYYKSMKIAYETVIPEVTEAAAEAPGRVEYAGDHFMACEDFEHVFAEVDGWRFYDGSESSFQTVDIYYNDQKKDACLFLNEYLHACLSNRPHYHEVFVHYPAHFLEKVKRVLFIGGGDSMVLHEALKYEGNELELVVGLELDQHVVRSTFAMMGMEPHFHNKKVEWWFGDAAATLNLIPTEYYGTFDLVVVDVLSEVAESLKVTNDVTIMEAAMMLMQPNGVIIKNEDEGYVPGTYNTTKFMEYTTDVMSHDVPVYCLQTFVMGSNSIDFSKTTPVDHNIQNFYIKGVDDFRGQFDTWHTRGTKAEAKKPRGDRMNPRAVGLAMILEAEEISIAMDSSSDVQPIFQETLTAVGLTITKSLTSELEGGGYTVVFVLKEGAVTARCFPEKKYCALDVQLWKSAHQAETIKNQLLSSLDSKDSSVYRVITTGIFGVEENDTNPKIGPPPKNTPPPPPSQEKESSEIETTAQRMKDPTVNFKNATTDDYDFSGAFAQWESQEPLAVQTITRLTLDEDWTREEVQTTLLDVLGEAIPAARSELDRDDADGNFAVKSFQVGKGLVALALFSEGSILCVWDGNYRLDATVFALEESSKVYQGMFRHVLRREMHSESADVELFPRGTGRVINLRSSLDLDEDTGERIRPFWAPPIETTTSTA